MSRGMGFWNKKRHELSPAERKLVDFTLGIIEVGVVIAEDVKTSKAVKKANKIVMQTRGGFTAFREELRSQRKDRDDS